MENFNGNCLIDERNYMENLVAIVNETSWTLQKKCYMWYTLRTFLINKK